MLDDGKVAHGRRHDQIIHPARRIGIGFVSQEISKKFRNVFENSKRFQNYLDMSIKKRNFLENVLRNFEKS